MLRHTNIRIKSSSIKQNFNFYHTLTITTKY